ncbi:MAG: response regulator [Chloroflexi bacterium]|nr:response regulator [Chloroflexota bacterium]
MAGVENKNALVLCIDDDADIRELLTRVLSRASYRVETAADGVTGLAAARTRKPAVVLLDIKMPGKSGIEVLQELKQADADLQIVMVSGIGDLGTALDCIKMGAADFVVKPFTHKDILRRVDEALETKRFLDKARGFVKEAEAP